MRNCVSARRQWRYAQRRRQKGERFYLGGRLTIGRRRTVSAIAAIGVAANRFLLAMLMMRVSNIAVIAVRAVPARNQFSAGQRHAARARRFAYAPRQRKEDNQRRL